MKRNKQITIATLLLIQLNGVPFAEAFMPELLQKARASGVAGSEHKARKPRVQTYNSITNIEAKIRQLKQRLLNDGFNPNIVDSVFNDNFEVYANIARLFHTARELDADSVWHKDPKEYERRYQNYRLYIGLDDKIRQAPTFLETNKAKLQEAATSIGLDKHFIVATIGMESDYGKNLGSKVAFHSWASQYFATIKKDPQKEAKRKESAYSQLKDLIRFSQISGISLLELKSSYAGCIGIGQWTPTNLLRYFTEKGLLIRSPLNIEDNIVTVALMHRDNGWNPKQNGSAPMEETANWRAIYQYNHSPSYVRAVSEIAQSLINRQAPTK